MESGPGFFYYDIDFPSITITPEDLVKIEKEMEKIVKENLPVKRTVLTKEEAIKKFTEMGEKYKIELISGFESETVSLYEQVFIEFFLGRKRDSINSLEHRIILVSLPIGTRNRSEFKCFE